jgi:chemotaxis protein methyltransferase CheR
MELSPLTFDELRRVIHRLCGLVIPEDKAYLILHRLEPVVLANQLRNFEDLVRMLRSPSGAILHDQIVEAITTSETSFLRDGHPFETFRRHLLERLGQLARERSASAQVAKVRIWSAGASTGQEPYSLAMLVYDFAEANRARGIKLSDFAILATDISARVLAVAEAAAYIQRDVTRGIMQFEIDRYFEKRGDIYVVRAPVRRLVEFRRVNLMQPFISLGAFDAIFCRNVLIYFDDDARRRICDQFYAMLSDGGWLVLGTAENLYGVSDRFESVHFGDTLVFRKPCTSRVV